MPIINQHLKWPLSEWLHSVFDKIASFINTHTKKNWLSEQARQFSFISVCLGDLTRKRMLIQPLEKGILGLTQSRTRIVHSPGKILIISERASHVRYHSTREYGVDFFQRRRELLYCASLTFVDLQSAMKGVCKYLFLKGSHGGFTLNSRESTIQLSYYLEVCKPTTEIDGNEGDCLVTASFVCQSGNKNILCRLLWHVCFFVCVCVFFYLFSQESEDHVGVPVFPQQHNYLDEVRNE